jgi:Phage integrase family.
MGIISTEDFIVIWLHLVTGAREGWGSEIVRLSEDLDNVKTSLIGLKWEDLEFIADSIILKVYEHKTQKTWRVDLKWLDPEIVPIFLKYRKDKGSIIKTLTKCKTVKEFRRYYEKLLEKISELLNLPFRLTPHDLRRSHISILAELGVPMEIAVSGLMDFGVGWEDLSTALIFYTRFSRYVKEKLLEEAEKRKREIEEKIKIK